MLFYVINYKVRITTTQTYEYYVCPKEEKQPILNIDNNYGAY